MDNLEAWLLRIAHNTSLDFLRRRSRNNVVSLTEDVEDTPEPETDIVAVGFQTFLQLPELPRCAVILKDVLGHSVEKIAAVADCTAAARQPENTRLPLLSDADRQKMAAYVSLFQSGDFDAIRAMLADDVKLDLVNRLKPEGRQSIGRYFTRYAEETKWAFAFGAVEGRPAMLVFDAAGPMKKPAHFVLIDWQDGKIATIRDFLFAPYAIEMTDWARLG